MKAVLIPLGLILLFGSGLLLAQPKRSPAALALTTTMGVLILALGVTTGTARLAVLGVLALLFFLGMMGWRLRK